MYCIIFEVDFAWSVIRFLPFPLYPIRFLSSIYCAIQVESFIFHKVFKSDYILSANYNLFSEEERYSLSFISIQIA